MPLPRFLVPHAAPAAGAIALPAGEARHLTRVLRLGVGDVVRVFDGAGAEWTAHVTTAERDDVRVELREPVAPAPEPPVRVTLAVGLLKGAQMDAIVRDATTLGAAVIAPLATAHVAVPPSGRRSSSAVERWRRVAIAAAKQSGRALVPDIRAIATLDAILADAAGRGDTILMCVEPALTVTADRPGPHDAAWAAGPVPRAATVFVGPEGGWAPGEVEAATSRGARLIALGPRTLRAETVPTVLLSALWTRWGW